MLAAILYVPEKYLKVDFHKTHGRILKWLVLYECQLIFMSEIHLFALDVLLTIYVNG